MAKNWTELDGTKCDCGFDIMGMANAAIQNKSGDFDLYENCPNCGAAIHVEVDYKPVSHNYSPGTMEQFRLQFPGEPYCKATD